MGITIRIFPIPMRSNLNELKVSYLPEANKDLERLDNSQKLLVLKAVAKVSSNPKSKSEGGHGTPLGEQKYCKAGRPV